MGGTENDMLYSINPLGNAKGVNISDVITSVSLRISGQAIEGPYSDLGVHQD